MSECPNSNGPLRTAQTQDILSGKNGMRSAARKCQMAGGSGCICTGSFCLRQRVWSLTIGMAMALIVGVITYALPQNILMLSRIIERMQNPVYEKRACIVDHIPASCVNERK